MQSFTFHSPVEIIFGEGRIKELGARLDHGLKRILVVTDKIVASQTQCFDALRRSLTGVDVHLFDCVEENPSHSTIKKGAGVAIDAAIQAVIGLGGGSPMDAAKGIALLAVNNGDIGQYVNGDEIVKDPLPIICIPTTSGTGSEVTPFAVFTDRDDQSKGAISHPGIFPKFSIIDPELTFTMPQNVVVNTGLDAMTHSIEAFLSEQTFPLNDLYAMESMRIIISNLDRAANHDEEAMSNISYAAMLSGIAITHSSTILLHVMGYPLTVFHDLPHGKANAVLLPSFMEFMRNHSHVKSKVAAIDTLFNEKGGIEKFVNRLGVSTRLSDYGVTGDDLNGFVGKTMVKSDLNITPAHVTEEAVQRIYHSAL